MSVRGAVLVVAAVLAAACAPRVDVENPSPFEEDDPAAGRTIAEPSLRSAAEPVATPVERRSTGTIPRADLIAVLDDGPAAFLAGLEITAEFAGNRFAGWRIVQFFADDPRYAAIDLRPGDIVRSVNRQRIERPQQLQTLWATLRTAGEIVIEAERAGKAHTLRFTVLDAA